MFRRRRPEVYKKRSVHFETWRRRWLTWRVAPCAWSSCQRLPRVFRAKPNDRRRLICRRRRASVALSSIAPHDNCRRRRMRHLRLGCTSCTRASLKSWDDREEG